MEIIGFIFILGASGMNDPACRTIAEVAAHQMNMDKMIINYIEKNTPDKFKGGLKVIYGVNDTIINRRITVSWSFP